MQNRTSRRRVIWSATVVPLPDKRDVARDSAGALRMPVRYVPNFDAEGLAQASLMIESHTALP